MKSLKLIGRIVRNWFRGIFGRSSQSFPKYPLKIPSELSNEYLELWQNCVLRAEIPWAERRVDAIEKIIEGKNQYEDVSRIINIPWEVVGVIHYLEASCSFKKNLHNGEPWDRRTRLEPKGRGPFQTWTHAAIDAIRLKAIPENWDISNTLYFLEKYNGMGYRNNHPHVLSPYLWSATTHYTQGKYASDGVFDRNLISRQVGAAAILKQLGFKGN